MEDEQRLPLDNSDFSVRLMSTQWQYYSTYYLSYARLGKGNSSIVSVTNILIYDWLYFAY